MVPSGLARREVEVVNFFRVRGLAGLPVLGEGGLETLTGYPEEVDVGGEIHPQPLGIFQNFILRRNVIGIYLLF